MEKERIVAPLSERKKAVMKKIDDVLDCSEQDGMNFLGECDEEEAEMKVADLKTWSGLLRFVKENDYDDYD